MCTLVRTVLGKCASTSALKTIVAGRPASRSQSAARAVRGARPRACSRPAARDCRFRAGKSRHGRCGQFEAPRPNRADHFVTVHFRHADIADDNLANGQLKSQQLTDERRNLRLQAAIPSHFSQYDEQQPPRREAPSPICPVILVPPGSGCVEATIYLEGAPGRDGFHFWAGLRRGALSLRGPRCKPGESPDA